MSYVSITKPLSVIIKSILLNLSDSKDISSLLFDLYNLDITVEIEPSIK